MTLYIVAPVCARRCFRLTEQLCSCLTRPRLRSPPLSRAVLVPEEASFRVLPYMNLFRRYTLAASNTRAPLEHDTVLHADIPGSRRPLGSPRRVVVLIQTHRQAPLRALLICHGSRNHLRRETHPVRTTPLLHTASHRLELPRRRPPHLCHRIPPRARPEPRALFRRGAHPQVPHRCPPILVHAGEALHRRHHGHPPRPGGYRSVHAGPRHRELGHGSGPVRLHGICSRGLQACSIGE
ncbi:hypothetical protein OH76DRAFT_1197696 [Lentinus brumalis]|uniref:Uncharacterized protein n=1 Tax=Lentinus brumalis TaxID=2498619 RepID=A0A371CTD3_9APHY|nr:hypothetical protein OH76DRAFT_1197696 [Polyporus brumalis]